jgi:hypothetical protein
MNKFAGIVAILIASVVLSITVVGSLATTHDGMYFLRDGSRTMTGNIDTDSNRIVNIGDPGTNFSAAGGLTLADTLILEDDALRVENPAATFQYTITAGAIAADRALNLPLITGADTLPAIGLAQSWTADQTYTDNTDLRFGATNQSILQYDGTDTMWELHAVGTGGLMLGIGATPPSPDNNAVHIWRGSAGVVNADTNSVAILESNGDAVLQILTPNISSGKILFGSFADNSRGTLEYFGSTDTPADTMRMRVGGNIQFNYTEGALAFAPATTISTDISDLTLEPAASLNVTLTDDDLDALDMANSAASYYRIDTRNTSEGNIANRFDTEDAELTATANATYSLAAFNAYNVEYTGNTNVTDAVANINIGAVTYSSDTATVDMTRVSSLQVPIPIEGADVDITEGIGIIVKDGGAAVTQYGLYIDRLTSATNDVAIYTENGLMLNMTTGGPTAPDNGFVHIWRGDASATAYSQSNLVLENSGNAGLSILSGATSAGTIWFGDSGSATIAYIEYDHSADKFITYVGGSPYWEQSSELLSINGTMTIETTSNDLLLEPAGDLRINTGDDLIITNSTTTNVDFFTVRASDGFGGLNISPITELASGNATYITQDYDTINLTGPNPTIYSLVDVFRIQSNKYTATNAGQTITNARTLYVEPVIKGAGPNTPTIDTATTLYISSGGTAGTTNYALWVDQGRTRIDEEIEMYEMTAPGVAPTDGARLFVQDNGAGKTQLAVIFSSGAIQIIATEP